MKHISATPFNDALNELAVQLPESILHYINSKFPTIHNVQEKSKLECSSQKFWQTIITNSIPTLESYIDDVHSSFSLNIPSKDIYHAASKVPTLSTMQLCNAATNTSISKFPKQKHPDLHSFLSSFDFIDFPVADNYPPSFDSEYSKAIIDSFIRNFSECLHIDNRINFDLLLPAGSSSTKDLAGLEVSIGNKSTKSRAIQTLLLCKIINLLIQSNFSCSSIFVIIQRHLITFLVLLPFSW